MLLDEAAGKGGEATVGIFAVLDPRDHAGQRLRGLRGGDDQLVGVVPDLGVGGEAVLHRFDVARFDRVEEALRHVADRSEEHTSELQSLMRISYAVFCLNKKKIRTTHTPTT